jgi:serine/threonine protein kinase
VGSGAFATVWLAEDETLNVPVAIKVLAENWSHDEEVHRRFLEEARILWRADSDHIVRIHNVDTLPDGRPYFVMDLADRGTLHERMRGRVQAGGRYSIEEAIAISLAIADGLKVAHALGIVHRDLKPANVMFQSVPAHHGVTQDEKLILTDFGMAKSVARSRGTTIATGTPYYMAPEQTEGRADERSDIYSAGVVLFELLAGRVPYPYDSPGRLFAAQMSEPPTSITELRPDIPPALGETLHRALAVEPAQRWPRVEAWADALTAARKGVPPAPLETALPGVDLDVLRTMAPSELAAARGEKQPLSAEPGSAAAASAPGPGEAGGVAPPPPPPTPPPAPPTGGGGRRRRRRALVIGGPVGLVIVGVAAAVIAIVFTGAKTADAKTLALDPVSALGRDPFTPSVVPTKQTPVESLDIPTNLSGKLPPQLVSRTGGTTLKKLSGVISELLGNLNVRQGATSKLQLGRLRQQPAGQALTVSGSAPGLYGGTQILSVCDKRRMIDFLRRNLDKARAWAKVQGISVDELGPYISRLTDVVLQFDTRVTNHGYRDREATVLDEVLQRGTAVLVDAFGIPRARCYCGNPLTEPRSLAKNVEIQGKPWPGFTLSKTVVVKKKDKAPEFATIDVLTGSTAVYKKPGASPKQSTLKPQVIPPVAPAPTTVTTPTATTPTETTPTETTPTETTPTETTPTETTPTETTPTVTTPTVTTPTQPTTTTTPPPPAPVPIANITAQGSATASSTYSSQYPASFGIDGNLSTSWFSVGDKEGNTSTYTWLAPGGRKLLIDHIQLVSNVFNSDASIRTGFTFRSVQVSVLKNNRAVKTKTIAYPSESASVKLHAIGDAVLLTLIDHVNPACGGFGELRVFGRPA